jgi:tetratricopeptide (TPR) repeat protein
MWKRLSGKTAKPNCPTTANAEVVQTWHSPVIAKGFRLALLTVAVSLLFGVAAAARHGVHELKVGEITVTYTDGCEKQASTVALAAQKVMPAAKSQFSAAAKAVSDVDDVARRVTDLLGCPEYFSRAKKLAEACVALNNALIPSFGNILLINESDIKTPGSLKMGCTTLSYDPGSDRYSVLITVGEDGAKEPVARPVVVRDDGSIYTKGLSLDEYLADWYDQVSAFAVVHEVAEMTLSDGCQLRHPFARWFNEGVANWVAARTVADISPDLAGVARESFLPCPKDHKWRSKVNLPAWPQLTYSKPRTEDQEAIESANYRYAAEAIDKLIGDQSDGTLARVVSKLRSTKNPDTDAICEAVQAVTGKNAGSIVAEYVPRDIRAGMRNGRAVILSNEFLEEVKSADYKGAVKTLESYLLYRPTDMAARFNLAWAMRRCGMPRADVEQQICLVAELVRSRLLASFTPCQEDEESYYLFGRLAQLAGDKPRAKSAYQKALALKPGHRDAESALEELENGR